jgi:hypothetical protein
MELNPSSEAETRPTTQEIPNTSRNLKAHYRVNKSLSLVSVLNQINSVHSLFHAYLTSALSH